MLIFASDVCMTVVAAAVSTIFWFYTQSMQEKDLISLLLCADTFSILIQMYNHHFKRRCEDSVDAYREACQEMTRQSLLIRQLYTQNHNMAADLFSATNHHSSKRRRLFSASANDIVTLSSEATEYDAPVRRMRHNSSLAGDSSPCFTSKFSE